MKYQHNLFLNYLGIQQNVDKRQITRANCLNLNGTADQKPGSHGAKAHTAVRSATLRLEHVQSYSHKFLGNMNTMSNSMWDVLAPWLR